MSVYCNKRNQNYSKNDKKIDLAVCCMKNNFQGNLRIYNYL